MSSQSGIQDMRRDNGAAEATGYSLAVVSQELMETIRNAHLALEDCVDGRGGSTALVRSGQLLHQASGALKLAETYGAALLAEEMEAVCDYLASLRPGKGRDDGFNALTRSIVQLPIYIERLLSGGRDIALVLLPLLNDLRAARGQALLSEGTLLLLNLSPKSMQHGQAERKSNGEDPVAVANKLRPKFQAALLGWLNGTDAEQHLQTLSNVIDVLEQCANRDDMYQLWWVVNGVLESLQNGGLESSAALKRLLGQTDRQFKMLIDEGIETFDRHPVADLLNNLLYYVARSSNAGERVSEIRAAFNLEELLPADEQVEHARESLAAPSVKLMHTVGLAIKEDLGRVKDVVDIYVRTGMNEPTDLTPQLDLLKKISNTLGVLGLGELRGDVEAEIDRLRTVVAERGTADEETLIAIAATLLRVESRLDPELRKLIVPLQAVASGDEPAVPSIEDNDYKEVAEAVMRECIINLARIKESVSQSLSGGGDFRGLDSIPALVSGIKAGLMMLNKARAMEIVDRIGGLISLALSGGGPHRLTQPETDRLADAIVSLEYYMDTVKAGRSEPWYMLDNAEACLAVLGDLEARLTAAAEEELSISRTDELARPDPDAMAAEPEHTATDTIVTSVVPAPVVSSDAIHLDPELLELFIEEAKEEIATIKRELPVWSDAPDDMKMLITVRRSFHTLKGTGRMVGAERIAEYSWSIEHLLNRLINRTLASSPPMVEFILEAAAVLPELVEQLEVGTDPVADVDLIIKRARAFAEGDPDASELTNVVPAAQEKGDDADGLEMDPVLLDIFSKETAGHLQAISDYIDACQGHEPPFEVTDKLYRACHTLHGSANMANIELGVSVAGALNRFVRKANDLGAGLQKSGIQALDAAAKAIEHIVADINKPDRSSADYAVLIEHLTNLASAIEPPAGSPQTAQTTGLPPTGSTAEDVAHPAAYDAEIGAIFSEEAAELLESADLALVNWVRERESREHIEQLKRLLHTLKGGARMAGIVAMGDLSHEIEALLVNIDDGQISPDPQIDALLQLSFDELHSMRDLVLAARPVERAAQLEKRLHAINAGDLSAAEVAPGTDTAMPADSEAVEFSAEPAPTVSVQILDTPPAEPAATEDVSPPVSKPKKKVGRKKKGATKKSAAKASTEKEETAVAGDAAVAEVRAAPSQQGGEARQELARIDAVLLESLLNAAGEISIYHARLSQQINSIEFHVEELEQTVARLRDQLRNLEIETEAQIMHVHQESAQAEDFDPLELDRYSKLQHLSRGLAESASDMDSLKDLLQAVTSEADTLLVQQARVTAELQDGLMRTRMVPFQQHVPRLERLVRQTAAEAGKPAELVVEGAAGELDRQVLDKMLPPFEHMMRNAIIHGLEAPQDRQSAGKPATGRITIRLHREGAEMVVDVADDGAGLDVKSIRSTAIEKELLSPDSTMTDDEVMQLILSPGFSTVREVTQSAGRGVGMDVVTNEIKKLGGSLQISSVTGQGSSFTIRLPFTLAITQALIVRTGEEVYALPLPTVEGVARIARVDLEQMLSESEPSYVYGEQKYRFRHLGMYLGGRSAKVPEDDSFVPVILVRAGEHSAALLTDELIGSQEIVVKSVGPQLLSIRGVSGATILGDGRIVIILDINALVRGGAPVVELESAAPTPADNRPLAMIVDDSITVRRVMERFLERNGMRVITAKDGMDAINVLQAGNPDIILLDIEMPNMDGYEFATYLRNDERASDVPIIMITSRVGDKHRARAIEIGVNDYLGKPYQDEQLLESIRNLLEERGITEW